MRFLLSFAMVLAVCFGVVSFVHAGACYADPVFGYSGSGKIKSGVFLRNQACMDGSSVLGTLSGGTSVQVVGYTDGWYFVSWNGGQGWIGQQFLEGGSAENGVSYSYDEFMSKYPSRAPGSTSIATTDPSLLSRVQGYILLQVESHGEAWYVDPITKKRYYMKDGPTAYQMMRSFGLGISEKDYEAMSKGDSSMKSRLRGRIVLRVGAHGEAYYIHPKDLKMYYLQNGDEAYRVMRLYSLGIKTVELDRLSESTIPLK
jgi:hypothetical protein